MKFRYGEDAAEAKERLNHSLIGGREIKIVFAEENRKTPQEMRRTARVRYPIENVILFHLLFFCNVKVVRTSYSNLILAIGLLTLLYSVYNVVDLEEAIGGHRLGPQGADIIVSFTFAMLI